MGPAVPSQASGTGGRPLLLTVNGFAPASGRGTVQMTLRPSSHFLGAEGVTHAPATFATTLTIERDRRGALRARVVPRAHLVPATRPEHRVGHASRARTALATARERLGAVTAPARRPARVAKLRGR